MKKKLFETPRKGMLLILVLIAGCIAYSCSDNNNDTTPTDSRTIKIAENSTFGKVLTDKDGRTLYFFSNDYKGTSACTGGCLDAWPIFFKDSFNAIDPSLNASDFGIITRSDGQKQTTYKGWPLYYYKNDTAAGQTNGDKVGSVWYVAKPDYTVMYVSAQLLGNDGNNYVSSNSASTFTTGTGNTFYITDSYGKTLYRFKNDTKDKNNFTASDLSNNSIWPITELNKMKVPSILNSADFNTITTYGKTQLTYKGWPLYYFGNDTNRGDNKGISVPAPNVWPIINTDTSLAP